MLCCRHSAHSRLLPVGPGSHAFGRRRVPSSEQARIHLPRPLPLPVACTGLSHVRLACSRDVEDTFCSMPLLQDRVAALQRSDPAVLAAPGRQIDFAVLEKILLPYRSFPLVPCITIRPVVCCSHANTQRCHCQVFKTGWVHADAAARGLQGAVQGCAHVGLGRQLPHRCILHRVR